MLGLGCRLNIEHERVGVVAVGDQFPDLFSIIFNRLSSCESLAAAADELRIIHLRNDFGCYWSKFCAATAGGRIRRGVQVCLTGEFVCDLMFLLLSARLAGHGWRSLVVHAPGVPLA
jgi:hypothetical protein